MSFKHSRPFENSYWVLPDKLLAGATPGIRNKQSTHDRLRSLADHRINTIINLTEEDEKDHEGELFYNYSLSHAANELTMHRFPIKDMDIPSPIGMARILALIDRELNTNRKVYIHCWGGLGRTGTVVGCFLLKKKLATPESVFKSIVELKSISILAPYDSPQTEGQREFIRDW
jgi:protein-tyrosine phosphatase